MPGLFFMVLYINSSKFTPPLLLFTPPFVLLFTPPSEKGCKTSGVKVIRLHDLRHSHVSLLIDMGFSALAIADRVGHESIDITYRYAHLFPTRQTEMANQLNNERIAKGA